jgi:guanine nucleotide-binding protein G(i) subunit alpha
LEIDKEMKRRKRFLDSEIKLLLLGAGESGKSTIAKQMKIIHLRGYSEAERMVFRDIVYSNLVLGVKQLCKAMDILGLELEHAENESRRLAFVDAPDSIPVVPSTMAADIKALWADSGFQVAFKSRNLFQLSDSAQYFIEAVDRIADAGYIPTEQDVLRARVKTTGIAEITFTTNDINFRMVDVGGQRSERKKWIHCFQDVTAVIFCVAMSEYDQKLSEDETVGRTEESIKLFDEICNSKWFNSTSIILFLNKKDLFAEKIKVTDLSTCFPEYKDGSNFEKAANFMQRKFVSLNRNQDKQIYPYQTCGTNSENIKFVFAAVRDIILQGVLDGHGF